MKKFLTVLLALSVVFTYTVGTAFAAVADESTSSLTHDEAIAQAQKELLSDLASKANTAKNALASTYKETSIDENCVIDGSVYAATIDKMVEDFTKVINTATNMVDKEQPAATDVDTLKTAIAAQSVESGLVYNNTEISIKYSDFPSDLVGFVTASASDGSNLNKYYIIYTWVNAADAMKTYLNGEIAKLDMSLYTNDVADSSDPFQKTWAEIAAEAKQDLLDKVSDTTVDLTMSKKPMETALKEMYGVLDSLAAEKTIQTISGEVIVSYRLADSAIKTADDLADANAGSEATKASLKALVQKNAAAAYAAALAAYNTAGKTDAAKATFDAAQEKIDAYVEVNNVLIDAGKITTENQLKQGNDPTGQDACVKRVEAYEDAADYAAVLKLQVEKDGSLKYVASKIDENLAAMQIKIYNNESYSLSDLMNGALNVASNLEWEKEVAVAAIKAELEDVLSTEYYDAEKAKVEAKYQELIDKVNSVTTPEQLAQVAKKTGNPAKYIPSLNIDTKADVNRKVAAYTNTTKFMDAVNNYIAYLNIGIAPYEDGYRDPLTAADKADVATYLAENGARTNADVANLLSKAEEYAKAVQTNAEKKAAKTAVEELIKAIPNAVTLADKDAVKAAYEAADEIGYSSTKLTTAIGLVQAAEAKAIDDMIAALPKTLTAADKDAVDAILAAIDAFNDEEMYTADYSASQTAKAQNAFTSVRAAALADVQNAIAALPDDPTREQVEAVRAAVDAFVAEYTDASIDYQAIAKITNLDKLTYAEAVLKAKEIKAVEALKITASSVAKKGSITVKWTVKGDSSAADGFQVYRSLKMNSGFGTKAFFTTTDNTKRTYKNTKSLKKGTRYYYKIRAYKVVDGVKYYSDWSNKAYRIAK